MGVVQKLKTDTLVTQTVQRGRIIETFYTLKTIDYATVGFLVIEVVLAEIGIHATVFLRTEQVHGKTVDTDTDVIHAIISRLRRSKPAALFPDVVDNTYTAGIVRTGRVGKVSLQAKNVNGTGTGLERIKEGIVTFGVLLKDTVDVQLGIVFRGTAEIKAVVLSRISRGGRTLDTQAGAFDIKVVVLTIWGIEIDVGRDLKFLVVGGIDKSDITHNAHDGLAFRTELVNINISAFLIKDVIILKKEDHLVRSGTVYDIIGELLLVGKSTGIDTEASYVHIGRVAHDTDIGGGILDKRFGGGVLHGPATDTVDIQFHQTVTGLHTHDKGDLKIHITGEFRTHFGATG